MARPLASALFATLEPPVDAADPTADPTTSTSPRCAFGCLGCQARASKNHEELSVVEHLRLLLQAVVDMKTRLEKVIPSDGEERFMAARSAIQASLASTLLATPTWQKRRGKPRREPRQLRTPGPADAELRGAHPCASPRSGRARGPPRAADCAGACVFFAAQKCSGCAGVAGCAGGGACSSRRSVRHWPIRPAAAAGHPRHCPGQCLAVSAVLAVARSCQVLQLLFRWLRRSRRGGASCRGRCNCRASRRELPRRCRAWCQVR
ncbi:unnamed protein product [Durusdinium trenchii]|uniref:Uncharacterized protein n=1 Tax=Durusdinium trenchii TaxID=1381693 RepID=A0ABP0IAI8_9DINO